MTCPNLTIPWSGEIVICTVDDAHVLHVGRSTDGVIRSWLGNTTNEGTP